MQIETTAVAAGGEARRHLQTLQRRRWYVIVPLLLGIGVAFLMSRGGEDTFVAQSVVRVPDPGQASVFSSGGTTASSSETERVIASAIQLIRGNTVRDLVQEDIGQDAFDQITVFEVSSVSDTLFVQITTGSPESEVAQLAARSYAEQYVAEQSRLDVENLRNREDQLRNSAELIDSDLVTLDEDLELIDEQIVILDFEIEALTAPLESGIVPQELIDKTIERKKLERQQAVLLGNRSRDSAEQSFLRQEASNLQIEQSFRLQTGAQIVTQPETPSLQPGRSLRSDIVVFGLLGLMLGVALALAREYFDSKVKSVADLHDIAQDIPVVGAIPKMRNIFGQPHLAVATGRPWYAAEAYRALRTTILALHGDPHRAWVFSSVGANAGKSVTVTNLATSMAQAGYKTLVIDANMRRPTVHMKLRVANDEGIAQLLTRGGDLRAVIQPSPLAAGLDVIPAGPVPANPAELLGSSAMSELMRWARQEYHFVLVDSPPLDVFTDAAVLGHMLGGLFMVVRFDATNRNGVSEALDQLDTAGISVLGFVANGRELTQSRAARYARNVGARNVKTLWTDRPGTISVGHPADGVNGTPTKAGADAQQAAEPPPRRAPRVERDPNPVATAVQGGQVVSATALLEDALGRDDTADAFPDDVEVGEDTLNAARDLLEDADATRDEQEDDTVDAAPGDDDD